MHARRCWEKRGNMQILKPGDRRKLVRKRQGGEGKVRHRNKDERKKLLRREAEVWILNPNDGACKKLWRDEGRLRYWNRMNAGSCGEAQMGVTLGGHATVDIKSNECRKLLRGTGNIEARWMQEVVVGHRAGSLDIKTKWTQEVMGRLRGKYRYWNPLNAGSLGSLMRGTGGEVRYWNQMSARSCWEKKTGEVRHWNQVEMHAKSC